MNTNRYPGIWRPEGVPDSAPAALVPPAFVATQAILIAARARRLGIPMPGELDPVQIATEIYAHQTGWSLLMLAEYYGIDADDEVMQHRSHVTGAIILAEILTDGSAATTAAVSSLGYVATTDVYDWHLRAARGQLGAPASDQYIKHMGEFFSL